MDIKFDTYNLLESPFSMFNLKELPPGVPQLITRSSSTLNTLITTPLPTTLTATLTTVNTRSLNHSTCPPTPHSMVFTHYTTSTSSWICMRWSSA